MIASVGIVALNEQEYLPEILNDLLSQTYDHQKTEILLVDGGSCDKTRKLMNDFSKKYSSEFYCVQVLDNENKIQSSGWNIVINSCCGDVIFRIDAHSHIPKDFIEKNMILQQNGFFVTGGIRPCIIKKPTPWKRLLLAVENSMWGSSFGRNKHGYVKSMFHPAYRREVFEKVGLFNEKLIRTEDNEMNYRIRMAGYKLYSDDEIISWQYARNDLKKMIKQKFSNGYWIGLTLSVCPGCICLYHLMPFLFIFAIFFTTVLMFLSIWQIAVLMWIIYISFGISAMVVSVIKKQVGSMAVFMPILFLILHASYGMGTLVGILNISSFKKY